ncbi:putative disease resistance protein At3g14460 isoform X2 [Malus sylvestris]|uniref:putative disease resistance protein At3g14460 isoform X2 n=1 Tax=Malus sylvestris TaxID=3752 RepID=UPI0021ACE767|nr:putative disease resistance protein At3g14460 isoform X2 [Malus sylvestris]
MRSVFKSSSASDEFYNSLEPKISKVLRELDLILKERDALGLKEGVQHRPQDTTRRTTSRVDESGVFGREKDRETILKSLRSNDTAGIGVLPIVGMGGIGKSTLAQLVYKDVKDDFNVQAWVCVGEKLDILQIAQTIYGRITKKPCTITDLDLLSEELEEVLTGKKFLFVLDDVWSEDYELWNKLMTHFNSCGVHGSKIIVTTRLGRVASITGTLSPHYLEKISEDVSWLLFAKHAFTNDSVVGAHPELEVIGRQIVKKCQGLPLAIKSLGGLLHSNSNPKEWEKILKSDLWKLSKDTVLSALWLSYHYLPPHLKRCFAYCSIFPKGYRFGKRELILFWMAEDLLQSNEEGVLDPEEVGSDYFDNLLSRSFFQHSSNTWDFTMHDIMNDLAKFVAGEFCLRLEGNQLPNKNLCKTRHFSFMKFGGHGIQKFEALDEAKHLHTFLQIQTRDSEDCNKLVLTYTLGDLLPNLPCLRVLKLSSFHIDELPSSIGNLKQLRHLDVSFTSIRELPETVCTIYNLQTLLLVSCLRLIQLPSNLGRLINLRHLNMLATEIKKMPAGMCNLKNLQTLSDFVVDKQTAQRIGELKELQHLRGYLTISGVGNIDHEGNALEAGIMSNKEYLDKLVLKWGRGDDDHDPQNDREVLNKLQPHTNLKQLEVISYGGVSFPGWLGHPSFSKLSCIKLKNFQHCCLLPPLGQLHSLKELHVLGMNNVVEIGSEYYGNDTCGIIPFRSLQKLFLEGMLEWEKWSYYDGSRGNTTIVFPNLRELGLKNCPKLTEILPLEKLQSLERAELCGLESFSGSLSHVESECPQFLSVAHLKMDKCPNFVCFPDGGMDAPKLEDLLINGCKKLRSLPEQMHTLLPSLQKLEVFDCPEVESYYDGSGGNTTILFPNLRELVLRRCPKLTEIVPLEKPPRLERVQLQDLESFSGSLAHVESECPKFLSLVRLGIDNCPNFVCFPDGGMDAPKLEELRISECKKLRSLPEQMHTLLPSLQYLEVFDCPEVESYYDGSGGNTTILFPNLRDLVLSRCPKLTEMVPLEKLPRLESVELYDLESFSGSLAHVESECPQFLSLTYLEIRECPNFACFPDGGMDAPKLEELDISRCKKLRSLPEQMHTLLPSLQKLRVVGCPEVESFPQGGLPSNLQDLSFECRRKLAANRSLWGLTRLNSLRKLDIVFTEEGGEEMGCSFLEEGLLPATLTSLSISFHPNLTTIQGKVLRQLTSLQHLTIKGCPELQGFPEQMHTLLPSLQNLMVIGCPEVESFPQGGLASNIQDLSFQCCRKLAANRSLWGLTRLNSLRHLKIRFSEEGGEEMGCSFPEEGLLPPTLTRLSIYNLPNLTTIQGKVLRQLTSLEVFTIHQCPELQGFPEQMHTLLPSLQKLELFSGPKVESFPHGGRSNTTILFPNLRELVLSRCPKLTEIVPLEKLPRLESVQLWDLESFNGSLAHVESECPKFLSLVHLRIDNCPNFVSFPDGGMDAPKLEELRISQCKKLRSLPEQMHTLLPSLQKLEVFSSPKVESFPHGGLPSNLQHLRLDCCRKLAANCSLWGLKRLNSLRDLKIFFTEEGGEEMGCSFPDEGLLPTALTHLAIRNLPNLTTIQGKVLRQLTSLEDLTIYRCPELQCFLEEAPKSLKSLTICECPNIRCLPGAWLPTSLSRLKIWRCPLLEERFRERREDWPKIDHIPRVSIT